MKKPVVMISTTLLCIFGMLLLNGCAENYQNLNSVNQVLGNAQRSVEYANTVKNLPGANKQQILKNAGDAVIQQNPALQQATQTIRATKELANSVKALNQ
jgi:hypothetical protein